MRRRRILLAGIVALMPKCVIFGELVGTVAFVGGQGKQWVGYLLNNLIAFGINAYQWATVARGKEE